MASPAGAQNPNFKGDPDRYLFDTYFFASIEARMRGDNNAAFELLKKCRKLDYLSPAVLFEMSRLLAASNEYAYAADYAAEAAKIDTLRNPTYVRTAILYLKVVGKLHDVLPLYDKLIDIQPDERNELLLEKAAIEKNLTHYDDALKTLDLVSSNEKKTILDVELSRTGIYEAAGKYRKENKLFKSLNKRFLNDLRVMVEQSRYYYNRGLITESKELCEKVVTMPGGSVYYFVLADIYRTLSMDSLFASTSIKAFSHPDINVEAKTSRLFDILNRPDNMMFDAKWRCFFDNVFYSLLNTHPDDQQSVALAYNYYYNTDRQEKATKLLRTYVSQYPGNEFIWRNLISSLQNDPTVVNKDVIDLCQRAVDDMPEHPFFHLILGQALQMDNQSEKGLAEFLTADDLYQYSASQEDAQFRIYALHGIAECYHALDSLDQCFAVYDKILIENPDDAAALNNYAYWLAKENRDLERAERMSSQSLKSDALSPTYLDTYAFVLYKRGRYSEAKFIMERCLAQLEGQYDAVVLYHYADILEANGEKEKATEMRAKAKEYEAAE